MSRASMVFLGFGKWVRADRIYALEPITGADRGRGQRTRVWVEGIPEPLVASRTEQTILEDLESAAARTAPGRSRRRRRAALEHPQLFEG